MKIALVILHADPSRGGAERYTVDLAASLATRGHDVRVIATTFADDAIPSTTRVKLEASSATRAGTYKRFLDLLDAHLATERYDVVHAMLPVRTCDVYHPHAGMAAEQAREWNALFNPRRRAMARVERDLLLRGSRPPVVIALSEYVKRSIRRFYDLPNERLVTLFNAVDLERFDPDQCAADREEVRRQWYVTAKYPGDEDSVLGLMIANDFARKGLEQTMRAWGNLWEKSLTLLVVGKERPPKFWVEQAKTTQGAHAAYFPGPTKNPRRWYAGADFFVLPTKHDPCSLVVLEALAMGLPVISTVCNGATEIMTDGVHGYVLQDPRDVEALTDAMRKMLDPPRRAAMSKACLELRPRLSYEHHLDQLEAIYRGIQSARR